MQEYQLTNSENYEKQRGTINISMLILNWFPG